MFKVIVLFALIAVVYSVPESPINADIAAAEGPRADANPVVDASVKAVNGEIDPKNEKEELEGAEFGWGWKNWGWGYPVYRSYHHYPVYYRSFYYPSYWW